MSATERIKSGLLWLTKEVVKAAVSPITKKALAVAGSILLPAGALWVQRGRQYFTAVHPIQGWVVSLAATIVLLVLWVAVWEARTLQRLHPAEKIVNLRGFAFVLTKDFWLNWRTVDVRQAGPPFLTSVVRGPYCLGCMVDLNEILDPMGRFPQVCPHCGYKFGLWSVDEVNRLRVDAYVIAQAAARRNALGRRGVTQLEDRVSRID